MEEREPFDGTRIPHTFHHLQTPLLALQIMLRAKQQGTLSVHSPKDVFGEHENSFCASQESELVCPPCVGVKIFPRTSWQQH